MLAYADVQCVFRADKMVIVQNVLTVKLFNRIYFNDELDFVVKLLYYV